MHHPQLLDLLWPAHEGHANLLDFDVAVPGELVYVVLDFSNRPLLCVLRGHVVAYLAGQLSSMNRPVGRDYLIDLFAEFGHVYDLTYMVFGKVNKTFPISYE